jgi:hypothetical protein
MSKLWSTFSQAPYALSIVYQASVVFVEAEEESRPSLPVRERRIRVMPFHMPAIDDVTPQIVNEETSIRIKGRNLEGDRTRVRFGDTIAVPDPENTSNDAITVDLPDLRCGIVTVQVLHDLDFGTPNEPHRGFASNVGVFMLSPVIDEDELDVAVTLKVGQLASGTIGVTFNRPVGREQRVSLSLFRYRPPADASVISYSIDAPADNGIGNAAQETTLEISFTFESVIEGDYLVQAVVDRARSGFAFDTVSGEYMSPRVTIA